LSLLAYLKSSLRPWK